MDNSNNNKKNGFVGNMVKDVLKTKTVESVERGFKNFLNIFSNNNNNQQELTQLNEDFVICGIVGEDDENNIQLESESSGLRFRNVNIDRAEDQTNNQIKAEVQTLSIPTSTISMTSTTSSQYISNQEADELSTSHYCSNSSSSSQENENFENKQSTTAESNTENDPLLSSSSNTNDQNCDTKSNFLYILFTFFQLSSERRAHYFDAFCGWIKDELSTIAESIISFLKSILQIIKSGINHLKNTLSSLANIFKSIFTTIHPHSL